LRGVDHGLDGAAMLDARLQQRTRRIGTEIAGLRPEVLEVAGVGHDDSGIEHREGMHAHGFVAEPGPGRKPHTGDFPQGVLFFPIEARVHVAAATRFERVDDEREPVLQHAHRVHASREDIRDRHGGTDHEGHDAIPDTDRILDATDRAVAATTAAEGIAVRPLASIELLRHDARVLRRRGIRAVGGDGGVDAGARHPDGCGTAAVGLDEVGAAGDREADPVLLTHAVLGEVLAVRHRRDVLEETSLIALLGREVEGEAGIGALEAAVHVAVPNRSLAPFVDVDVGPGEQRIDGRCSLARHDGNSTASSERVC
jgi:hypothetical protein